MKNQLALAEPKPIKTSIALAVDRVMQEPARVAISRNPLAVDIVPSDFSAVPFGSSLESLIPEDMIGTPMVCIIDGVFISRSEWHTQARPGEVIIFQAIPQGGDSNPLRVLATLAVIFVAATYGAALGAFLGFSGATAAAVGGFVINFLGSLAINALIPLPSQQSGNMVSASPTYSIAFQGNSARIEQPIPVGYGQQMTFPDFASQPYVEYIGNEQYYSAILCIGKGQYNVLMTKIDDTDIRTFQDVTTKIIGPGQFDGATIASQSLVDPSIVTTSEVAGQELTNVDWVGAFAVCRSGYRVSQIQIDMAFPRGLGHIEDDGSISAKTAGYQMHYRPIDDSEKALGPWVLLATESATFATATPQVVTTKYTVPSGRYQVRIRRTEYFQDEGRTMHSMSWVGMRARVTELGIKDETSTFLCVRVRASKQLSGNSQRRFAVLWQRLVPIWTGTGWTTQFTRNPAWAIADIWRNAEYGRGLPDSRIDLVTLSALAAHWSARQDHFDFVFDTKTTVFEASQLAARAGRAVPIVRRGRYTLVRDEEQMLPVAMYTPRNMRKGTLAVEYAMPPEDMPDSIRVKYRSGKFWDERSVIAQIYNGVVYVYRENAVTNGVVLGTSKSDLSLANPLAFPAGIPSPSQIQDVSLPGVIGEKQAMREAAYILAAGHFRRQTVSFSTDSEGLIPSYGSLVAVSHDMMQWGQSGEIIDIDTSTRRARASVALKWTAGASHYIRIAGPHGEVSDTIAVTVVEGSGGEEFLLSSLPDFEIITHDADRECSRFSFGDSVQVSEYIRLKGLRPRAGNQIDLLGVVEDSRVHDADSDWLPVNGEIQDPLDGGGQSEFENLFTPVSSLYPMESRIYFDTKNTSKTNLPSANDLVYPSLSINTDGSFSFGFIRPGSTTQIDNAAFPSETDREFAATAKIYDYAVGAFVDYDFGKLWMSGRPTPTPEAFLYEVKVDLLAAGTTYYFPSQDGVTVQQKGYLPGGTPGPEGFYIGPTSGYYVPLTQSVQIAINGNSQFFGRTDITVNVTIRRMDDHTIHSNSQFAIAGDNRKLGLNWVTA